MKDSVYFENQRMAFAEICRKKMEPMKARDNINTMKGSLNGR